MDMVLFKDVMTSPFHMAGIVNKTYSISRLEHAHKKQPIYYFPKLGIMDLCSARYFEAERRLLCHLLSQAHEMMNGEFHYGIEENIISVAVLQ